MYAIRSYYDEADAGNIGINIGVAAPMAFFPFSGWKESFFGDMHLEPRLQGFGHRRRGARAPRHQPGDLRRREGVLVPHRPRGVGSYNFV